VNDRLIDVATVGGQQSQDGVGPVQAIRMLCDRVGQLVCGCAAAAGCFGATPEVGSSLGPLQLVTETESGIMDERHQLSSRAFGLREIACLECCFRNPHEEVRRGLAKRSGTLQRKEAFLRIFARSTKIEPESGLVRISLDSVPQDSLGFVETLRRNEGCSAASDL
jgi:hypothetical protein